MTIKQITTLLIFIFLASFANAVSVNQNDVIISSDDTFYCQPILNHEGACLIQSYYTITNNRASPINAKLLFDANKNIAIREYRTEGQSIALEKSSGKNINSINRILIGSSETKTFSVEFWTQETGKFNVTADFAGVKTILDPIFNTSFNTTSPSIHLVEGRVTQYNDSQFTTQTTITTELYDNSDVTKFETSRTEFTDNALLSFLYQGSSSFFGEVSTKADGSNATNNLDGPSNYYEANFASSLGNGDVVEIHFQDGNSPSNVYITNVAGTQYYGTFFSSSDVTTYFVELSGLPAPTSTFRIHANQSQDTGDQEIIDFIAVGETVEGQAIRTTFPIVFNTNNEYYLNVRKTDTGIKEFEVILYNNQTDQINDSLFFGNIISGDNVVKLDVNQNITASIRLFTSVIQDISEVSLIEGINDTVDPVVNDRLVNDTLLNCNDTVRLTANVTDDFFIDTVFISYNDSLGAHTKQADRIIDTDLFFIDVTTDIDTSGNLQTFFLSSVIGSDLAGNSIIDTTPIAYNYSCQAVAIEEIGIISITPSNNTVDSDGQIQFSVNVNNSGIAQLYLNNSLNHTIPVIPGNNNFPLVNLENDTFLEWRVTAIANNTVSSGTHILNVLFPFHVIAFILSPANGTTVNNGEVTFFASANTTGNITLYYYTSLDPAIVEAETKFNTTSANFTPINFGFANQTVFWFVNHSFNPVFMSPIFELNITIEKGPFKDALTVGQCPNDTTPNTLLIAIFFTVAFLLIVLALILSIDILSDFLGIIGGILLLIISWHIGACIAVFAWFIAGLGIVLIAWFSLSMLMGAPPSRMRIY